MHNDTSVYTTESIIYIHANKGCVCVHYVYMGMRHQALMKHEAIHVYVIICGRLNGGKGFAEFAVTQCSANKYYAFKEEFDPPNSLL